MRSVVDRAQRRRVVVVSLVLMVCAQSEPSLPGAKMAEIATARAKTRAHTTVSDGEGGGAGGDKRKIGRSEVWHAVLLRRTRTRRRRHASYPPARRLLGVRSLLVCASRFRLPPVYLSFSFYKMLSRKSTCNNTFFSTSSFSSTFDTTPARFARSATLHSSVRTIGRGAQGHNRYVCDYSSLRLHQPPKDDNHIIVFFSQLIRP